MSLPAYLRAAEHDVLLSVRLQPRASRDEIGSARGAELQIKVTAPPVDSAANEALMRLLAERLRCAKSRVELVRGRTSRHKVIRLRGFTLTEISAALQPD